MFSDVQSSSQDVLKMFSICSRDVPRMFSCYLWDTLVSLVTLFGGPDDEPAWLRGLVWLLLSVSRLF